MPSLEDLQEIERLLQKGRKNAVDARRWERRQKWRDAIRQDATWHLTRSYAYMRNNLLSSVSMRQRKDETLIGNWDEIDVLVRAAWDPIVAKFRTKPEPGKQKFRKRFDKYIQKCPMRLGDLTGADLQKAAKRWKARTAGGADGILVDEIWKQPEWLWEDLARALDLIERTGRWPPPMLEALGVLMI